MWENGSITLNGKHYHYSVKHYEERSCMGINGGRISKLDIWSTPTKVDNRRERRFVCRYDRGWSVHPTTKAAVKLLDILAEKYN